MVGIGLGKKNWIIPMFFIITKNMKINWPSVPSCGVANPQTSTVNMFEWYSSVPYLKTTFVHIYLINMTKVCHNALAIVLLFLYFRASRVIVQKLSLEFLTDLYSLSLTYTEKEVLEKMSVCMCLCGRVRERPSFSLAPQPVDRFRLNLISRVLL